MKKKNIKSVKQGIARKWELLDGSEKNFGRIATVAATYLIGKDSENFDPAKDEGSFVVITNVGKMKASSNKFRDKKYYRHSWYPGNLKVESLQEKYNKDPLKVMYDAVRGMLPKNKLQKGRLARLKLFLDESHPYQEKFKNK